MCRSERRAPRGRPRRRPKQRSSRAKGRTRRPRPRPEQRSSRPKRRSKAKGGHCRRRRRPSIQMHQGPPLQRACWTRPPSMSSRETHSHKKLEKDGSRPFPGNVVFCNFWPSPDPLPPHRTNTYTHAHTLPRLLFNSTGAAHRGKPMPCCSISKQGQQSLMQGNRTFPPSPAPPRPDNVDLCLPDVRTVPTKAPRGPSGQEQHPCKVPGLGGVLFSRFNYTIKDKTKAAVIEVQLANKAFYLKKGPNLKEALESGQIPTVKWGKHGGPAGAFEHAKSATSWEPLD
jgi:hypothetical protein